MIITNLQCLRRSKQLVFGLLLLLTASVHAQTIYYVRPDGDDTKDGKSWANAFATIGRAAGTGGQVWVARGTYYPDEGPNRTDNDRNASFIFLLETQYYGGFNGTETSRDQRNWNANATILSGDIQQDGNSDNNAYHVIRFPDLANGCIIDGFYITGGNANGSSGGGAAIKIDRGNVAINNCIFTLNATTAVGGAVYIQGPNAGTRTTITTNVAFNNCSFFFNTANKGGAIYISHPDGLGGVYVSMANCNFSNNTANDQEEGGGAIYRRMEDNNGIADTHVSTLDLYNCRFSDNKAMSGNGSAIYNSVTNINISDGSKLILADCQFKTHEGSVIFDRVINGFSFSSFSNCLFENNRGVSVFMRGIAAQGTSSFTGCSFSNNHARAIQNFATNNSNADPVFTNCTFEGNTGGAVHTKVDKELGSMTGGNSAPVFDHCTFYNNSVPVDNDGIVFNESVTGQCNPVFANCRFLDNTGHAVFNLSRTANGLFAPEFLNCSFSGNKGAAIKHSATGNCQSKIINCSFGNNSGPGIEQVAAATGTCTTTVLNSIIWGNQVEIVKQGPGFLEFGHSIIKGSKPNGVWDPGIGNDRGNNLDADPLFANAAHGNLALLECSPAIDKGSGNDNNSVFDLAGNFRMVNGLIDMGAYESTVGKETIPPVVRTKNTTLELDANGIAFLKSSGIDNGSADNCGIASMSLSTSQFDCRHVGDNTVWLTVTDVNGNTSSASAIVTVVDQFAPVALGKNITISLDQNGTAFVTADQVDNGSSDACGIKSLHLSKTTFDCTNVGANTVTLTVSDNANNTSAVSATITIVDETPPLALSRNVTLQLDVNGQVSITPAQVDNGSVDACGIKSLHLSKTSFDCSNVGPNNVTLTVVDNNNNISTSTAVIMVEDKIAPVITAITPLPTFLWPPDQKMKTVNVTTTVTDNCPGTTCRITGVAIKEAYPSNTKNDPDYIITGSNAVSLRAENPRKGGGRTYTITTTCTDASGNITTGTTEVVVAHTITSPASGTAFKVGATVNLAGEFWDVKGNKHTARWLIDDKITVPGMVTEPAGKMNGKVTGSYKFTTAGVYKLRMNVTDQKNVTTYANTNGDLDAIIVIYDPASGHTYGGGYFTSPAGALMSNPSATGDVTYGFAVNYYKTATYPKGETQFEFKQGGLEFNAVNFSYIAISGARAQFRGSGKITGGQSGVEFIMTVIDGELDGTGMDKIRVKIYSKSGEVIYDNQPGDSDAADPATVVGSGSTVAVQPNSPASVVASRGIANSGTGIREAVGLEVKAYPNPAGNHFNIAIRSDDNNQPVNLRVYDITGRLVGEFRNVKPGSVIKMGETFKTGVYLVKVVQGNRSQEVKLVKMADR